MITKSRVVLRICVELDKEEGKAVRPFSRGDDIVCGSVVSAKALAESYFPETKFDWVEYGHSVIGHLSIMQIKNAKYEFLILEDLVFYEEDGRPPLPVV